MITKLTITLLLITNLYAHKAHNYNIEPKKVAKGIWCMFGALEGPSKENAGHMSNHCYIQTNDSWVLWDAGPTYRFSKQSYAAMSKIAKLPVSTVILSHEHDDHWLGTNYYKEEFNATIIGPELINTKYKSGDKTRMFRILHGYDIEGTKIIKVDKVYKEGKTLTIGGLVIEYIPLGHAHSKEDYCLYLPKQKILLAGDVVMNGRITSNRDGLVMGQLKALNLLKSKDWSVLVPGHGFVTDKTATDESNLYFKLLKERVLKAIDNDVDASTITEVVTLPEFKNKKLYNKLNKRNIEDAYSELEMLDE